MAEDCIIKEDHETSEIQQNDKENISLNGNNLMEIQPKIVPQVTSLNDVLGNVKKMISLLEAFGQEASKRIESSWVDSQVEQIMLEYSLIYNNVAQFVTSEEQKKRIKPDTLKVEPEVRLIENNDEIKLEVNEHETLTINDYNDGFVNDNNYRFVKSEVKRESRRNYAEFGSDYFGHFMEVDDYQYNENDFVVEKKKKKKKTNAKKLIDGGMQCTVCDKVVANLGCLNVHMKTHREKLYKCSLCPKSFSFVSNLNTHINKAHMKKETKEGQNETKAWVCPLCPDKIEDYTFEPHARSHGEGPFQCPICYEPIETLEMLTIHKNNYHKQCPVCLELMDKEEWKSHQNTHGDGPYHCTKCDKSKDSIADLLVHQHVHSTTKCEKCNKSFRGRMIKIHMIKVHSDVPRYSECNICNERVFTWRLGLHMKNRHTMLKHECHICKKRFPIMPVLKVHMRSHTGERPYSCEICGASFKQSPHLVRHKHMKHEGKGHLYNKSPKLKGEGGGTRPINTPTICPECGKTFSSKVSLRIHSKTVHSDEKPYSCSKCEKTFKRKVELSNHEDLYHNVDVNYPCEECGQIFKNKIGLSQHKINKRKKALGRSYICNYEGCTNSTNYQSEQALKKHIKNRHLGIKQHVCDVCEMAFAEKSSLNQHMRVHTGEKPYKCEVCDKAFTQSSSLISHKKRCAQ